MNKKNTTHNAIPSIVFTPLKNSKRWIAFFTFLSLIFSTIMLFSVIFGVLSFNQEQLNGMADFTLNLVFVVAALGLTIFTLPLDSIHPKKDEIILSYIGTTLLIVSISIFTYILSFCDFLNICIFNQCDIFSIYFCAMLLLVCRSITSLLATIVAYFNIRE